MTCLAVDTSGNHLTLLLLRNGEVVQSYHNDVSLKHSLTLMPEIENLLEKSNITLNEIDVFCAVVGPGSFTGIRIGVSTVKALAYALGKKVLSVTSFDVLAYNTNDGNAITVIDARHDNFYVCGYKDWKIFIKPCFMGLEEVKSVTKNYPTVSDSEVNLDCTVGNLLIGLEHAVKERLHLASDDIESLIPLYAKKSQAEEERK